MARTGRGRRKTVIVERRMLHSVTRSLSWAHFLPAILFGLPAGVILSLGATGREEAWGFGGVLAVCALWVALGFAIRMRKPWAIGLSLAFDILLLFPAAAYAFLFPCVGKVWFVGQCLYVWGDFRALRAIRVLGESGLSPDASLADLREERLAGDEPVDAPADDVPELSVPCPHCSEPVRARARKCRHCGESLPPS